MRLNRGATSILLTTARLSAFAASLTFAALAVAQGPPVSPEGPGIERDIQYVFVGVGIVSTLLAWWRPLQGGWLLVVTGVALGIAAAGRYTEQTALLVALLFVAPGVLFLLAGTSGHRLALRLTYAAAVCLVMAYGGFEAQSRHDQAFGPAHPQSELRQAPYGDVEWVWSGGVTSTGATVTARLIEGAHEARLLLRPDESLSAPVSSPVVGADGDGIVRLRVDSLQADTLYHYAVEVDGTVDSLRRGTLRTFPEGAATFSIVVGACVRTGSNGAVFDALRAEDALLYLITGDANYENITNGNMDRFQDAYQTMLTSPAQAALYRETPVAYTWDDHDFGGSNSTASSPSREAARLSYRQNVPHYPLAAGDGNSAIYQAFSAGRVRFVLLDTRSMRNEEQLADGSRSLLGARQREWLKQELVSASRTHALVVLVSSVPWIAAESASGDDWGGYATERREIADFIADQGITNLMLLAGDAHMLGIDDGTNSDYSSDRGGAGFPVMHAAALDRPGSEKGGPYSEGAFPGAGQYGLVTFHDDGERMTVELRGRNWLGEDIVTFSFAIAAGHLP
ncbi:MAG TPA: alkaline phosphatase D family protein [Dehalococcoidia bacterium]|nr:alkaline phosphatase D family protein [Dehalococcoidia bacterium]